MMEIFLGVVCVFFIYSYYSTSKDYNRLQDSIGSIAEYEKTSRLKIDQHYVLREQQLKEKEQSIERTAQKRKNEIFKASIWAYRKQEIAEEFLSTKIKDFPILAQVIADYEVSRCDPVINSLLYRKPSAYKSAKIVQAIREENRSLVAQNKAYKWEIAYIRQLLPWLSELEEEPIKAKNTYFNTEYNKQDAAGYWLTPEEYQQLSPSERNQRALDRYKKRHKTNAEIGRDYERYIGYLYEKDGYTVTYYGIERGIEDLGRDLICKRGNDILVVQCKCWSNKKKKVIREKHLNQLYGTFIAYKVATSMEITIDDLADISESQLKRIDQNNLDLYNISAVFCSTVPFSPTAMAFAKLLDIECRIEPCGDYPVIKCNINARTGEKIYHLPFDQQYDKTIIIPKDGEFYAQTVQEAENAGFRRAMRWNGNTTTT